MNLLKKLVLCIFALASLGANDHISESTASLSFSLYSKVNQSGTNVVFSPFSIFTCLSMPYMGAASSTAAAIKSTLHITMTTEELAAAISSTMNSYAKDPRNEKEYQLNIANSVWIAENFSILTGFRRTLVDNFHAEIQNINFNQSDEAANTINSWVSLHTQGKIPNILSPNDLSAATKLVLANAIYFKGAWRTPFDGEKTKPSPFRIDADTCFEVPLMEQTARFPYYESEQLQVLALPFIGKDQSPDIAYLMVLPKQGDDFATLEKNLSAGDFQNWISSLSSAKVHVKCPKFVLDERINLNSILAALGMDIAFTGSADFSGIDGRRDLYIDKVLHQAFFSVDEAGVTAAAATAVSINFTSVHTPPVPSIEFIADHPFLFFLVDMKTKTPLFMGKINSPICSN